jgi:hypothetical protein
MNRCCAVAVIALIATGGIGHAQTTGWSLRQVTGTTTVIDYLTSGDLNVWYVVAWNSTAPAAKTEDLNHNSIACSSTTIGFTIKDEAGTAGTYPISIVPNGTDTIDKNYNATTPFVINSNFQSNTFQCDGAGNWIVE